MWNSHCKNNVKKKKKKERKRYIKNAASRIRSHNVVIISPAFFPQGYVRPLSISDKIFAIYN